MNDRPAVPSPSPIEVEISNTQGLITIDPAWVNGLVIATLTEEAIAAATVSIAFTDDATIRVINARHLGHDWSTDVISFRLDDESDVQLGAELIISAETAQKMAVEFGFAPLDELALYLVHGLLHTCGYDDQMPEDRAIMRRREAEILVKVGIELGQDRPVESAADPRGLDRESAPWPL